MSVPSESNPGQSVPHCASAKHAVGSIFIELRTEYGYRLLAGRRATGGKQAIIGLFGFADRLSEIWKAAQIGDPYARWWLLKVEAAYQRVHRIVRNERTAVGKSLADWSAFAISPLQDMTPRRIELRFACPYAYWGARQVKQFDELISELKTAVCIGANTKSSAMHARSRSARAMRNLFASAQGFTDFGLTTAPVEHGATACANADAAMGAIPADILNGEQWPVLLEKHESTVSGGATP